MTNLVDQAAVQQIAENAIGHYGWLLAAAFVALMGKDVLYNFIQGLLIFWGSSFKADEVLYISGRQARIVRVGVASTTFFMADRRTKMIVPNSQLKQLTVEKKLPANGGEVYLPKGSEQGPMRVELIAEEE
jgi:hypothetical protein